MCDRTYQVSDAIVTASGAGTCAHVTLRRMREITSLDLSYEAISSLSVGDFDGLVRLDTLDLSGNHLTTLPQGVFDELLLLKTLHLDNNLLQSLPVNLFDELLLLEELTLSDNRLTSLPEGMLAEFSRLWGSGALEQFLQRHGIYTVEQFIGALPTIYKQRFAMVYASESPAEEYVSTDYPRITSWGGDGRFTFAWNTDPAAPSELRDVVEFLRQDDDEWSAGVIDFSGATPSITEPASCQTCHGPLNKPLWGAYLRWYGTEYTDPSDTQTIAATANALESTDPRIEPLDFSASYFRSRRDGHARFLQTGGYTTYIAVVEEAGSVWSWRHAEVLFRRLKAREDYRRFAEETVCKSGSFHARLHALEQFTLGEHNLALLSDTGEAIQGGSFGSIYVAPDYHYHTNGQLGGALAFLMVADLWEREPIVRKVYRDVSNADTLLPTHRQAADVLLFYPPGSATAEDELIQKLRLHFGAGGPVALADLGSQNMSGFWSANFFAGQLSVMAPRVCNALTKTRPSNLRVTLTEGDAVLRWDTPEDVSAVSDFTGYRILRGVDGETPTVYVPDTSTTDTTWTDNGLTPGDYVWIVQALFDGYPSPESNAARETVAGSGLQVSGPTSFTIVEGDTEEVWTLSATGTDTPAADLVWSISGGADSGHFTLSASGVLAFAAAKDYEAPDDADGDGTYDVTVQVSDDADDATAAISVSLSNRNEEPTADAGADQPGVEEGATVTLSGTGEDRDAGDTLQYAWTQTGGDAVTLSAPSASLTTFAAPTGLTEDAVLTFTLRVTDDGGLSGEDDLAVTVVAGEAQTGPEVTGPTSFTVVEGETAVGTLSATDDDTPAADLVWSIAGGADSSHFTLSAGGVLAFTAAKDYEGPDDAGGDGTYDLTVQVSDGTADATAAISVSLSNRNEAPTANAGADQTGVEEGATVTLTGSGQDPDAGDTLQYAWTQTGGATVTLSAPSAAVTTFAAPSGLTEDAMLTFTLRVTDDGGLSGEHGATVTVVAPQGSALTASFQAMPASHDGETAFSFRVAFSEDIGINYTTLRDDSFTVTAGDASRARRVGGRHDLWEITVEPDSREAVTITLPGGRACGTTGAVCTREENPRPLTNSPSATVAGPPTEPLTASFHSMPASHDGTNPFTFELRFSEEIEISYVTLRDSAFTVTNGQVTRARRLDRPSNLRWEITVDPASAEDITIVLPGGRACGTAGAVCTAGGKQLSNSSSATVR